MTEPNDEGVLTPMGALAADLPIDLRLSRLLGLARQLGVLSEAVMMTGALSLPRSPFRLASRSDPWHVVLRSGLPICVVRRDRCFIASLTGLHLRVVACLWMIVV